MKKVTILLSFLISALLLQCGGNPEEDGNKAYAQGEYNQALSYYMQVKKSDPNNPRINEKIALTYMQRGLRLFEKRKNLASFIGNFEKGQNFIPETETSEEFNTAYSSLLLIYAKAHYNTKPANVIQKEQYFSKTLDLLDMSLTYNPDNQDAENMLTEIKTVNFEQTYKKGIAFFQQAKKEKNPDLYLTAQRYINRAVFFDPENKDAQSSLKKIRQKTLSILDVDSDFPFAIADKKYTAGYMLIAFTALNNYGEDLEFDPLKLALLDSEGKSYFIDAEHTAKFDDGLTEKMVLKARKQVDGTLAFAMSKSVKVVSLNYEFADGKVVKKYFP